MGWNRWNKFQGKIEDATVRDLWQHKDLGSFHSTFSAHVPQPSAVLLRVH